MKKSYVYKITCKITGEFYFGSSFNAKSDYYWGKGRKIKERILKYGKENFVKEILGEFDDRTESHRVENQYIEQFRHDDKCLNERIEYHFGLYGEESRAKISAANRGKHLSDETKAKMSAAKRGEKATWYGKHLSDETRAKISAANRGKHLSDETREKMSAANRGYKNPMYGKHRTAETRAKISAANRGKHFSEEHRAKLSAANRGKHLSDETRAKLSAALRGKPQQHGKHWRKNPITGKREYYD